MAIVTKLIFSALLLFCMSFITMMGFPYVLTIVIATLMLTWTYKFPNDIINDFYKKIFNNNDKAK